MKTDSDKNSPDSRNDENSNSLLEKKPLIIAGPCSAETPEQLFATASQLAMDNRVDYFRAGIWKPRTLPGTFEGVGAPGLEWMQQVKKQTGLKIITEVGSARHVEAAIKAGMDMLWVGARTVSNPFVVQEIADSLKGVDIPVWIKNPLSPDIDLWEGAITRFSRTGINKLGAIHRGFFWWAKSHMRNQPFWNIPLELQERLPGLPILSDPSHIAGKRSLVPLLARRALEKNLSGLMVEVHSEPDKAWSDASQQIAPGEFTRLLDDLLGEKQDPITGELLDELRAEVDNMDEMLVWALSVRMELAGKIAEVKKDACQQPLQSQRWEQIMQRVKLLAAKSGVRPMFIEKLFNSIHQESLSLQHTLINDKRKNLKKEHNFV